MSFAVIEKKLQSVLEAGWDEGNDCIIQWPGVEFETPNKESETPYLVFSIQNGTESEPMGYDGSKTMARRVGIVYAQFFYPAGKGVFACLRLCDKAKGLYEFKQFVAEGITITCSVGTVVGDNSTRVDEGWIYRVVRVPFYWDEFIAT